MTALTESERLTTEVNKLAIASGVTNTRLLELAGTQKSLMEAVAVLVKSGHESEVRHANFEQRIINMMDGMQLIRTDIASCNKDIKSNTQNIISVRAESAANKLTIAANWKMVAGAVSIALGAISGTYLIVTKVLGD